MGPTNTSILYINATNEEGNGDISLYTADANDLSVGKLVASLPAAYQGLKAVATDSGDIHFYSIPLPTQMEQRTIQTQLRSLQVLLECTIQFM